MDIQKILSACDHTLLRQTSTQGEIQRLCDEAIEYGCASVCIPPSHVAGARKYVGDKLPICTVIGFPNGYCNTATKSFEAADMVAQGADEIDMVANLCMIRDGCFREVAEDISAVRRACPNAVLKVIIETCLLTEYEKIRMCDIVYSCGADFIKTSTGFSTGGATFDDVALLRRHSSPHLKVKAAGGIATLEDAWRMLELGADRLGTSRLVKLAIAYNEQAAQAQQKQAVQYTVVPERSEAPAESPAQNPEAPPAQEPVQAPAENPEASPIQEPAVEPAENPVENPEVSPVAAPEPVAEPELEEPSVPEPAEESQPEPEDQSGSAPAAAPAVEDQNTPDPVAEMPEPISSFVPAPHGTWSGQDSPDSLFGDLRKSD